MAQVGFIGLGNMGGPMAQRLMDAGHVVTGYNRTQARAQWLIDRGMRWADTPRQTAEQSEVAISMLRDTEALEAIANGEDGVLAGLSPGKVFVDMSTVNPAASRFLAARVAALGASMLDAPVSGSSVTLLAGRLSIMVGGERDVYERVKPILQAIGPTVDYVGENGLAVTMKVATNLSLPVQILSFCESILLAEKSGIPRETAIRVLLNSVVASPALNYRIPLILNPPDEPLFDVSMMQKDLKLALDLGQNLAVPLPTTGLADQWLTAARGWGLESQDFAALFQLLAELSGVDGTPNGGPTTSPATE